MSHRLGWAQVLLHRREVEGPRHAECPGKRSTPLGLTQTFRRGVQPGPPAGVSASWVGNGGETRAPLLGHDPE
ncbi:hypothetical protein GCM10023222_01360 [Saccharopolyspora cebuensis]